MGMSLLIDMGSFFDFRTCFFINHSFTWRHGGAIGGHFQIISFRYSRERMNKIKKRLRINSVTSFFRSLIHVNIRLAPHLRPNYPTHIWINIVRRAIRINLGLTPLCCYPKFTFGGFGNNLLSIRIVTYSLLFNLRSGADNHKMLCLAISRANLDSADCNLGGGTCNPWHNGLAGYGKVITHEETLRPNGDMVSHIGLILEVHSCLRL